MQNLFAFLVGISMILGCGNKDPIDPNVECGKGIVGNPSQPPQISIESMGDRATTISGRANNVDASRHHVVVYVQTDFWYIQPYASDPFISICTDGSWETWSHPGDRVVALIVDESFVPKDQIFNHPAADPGVLAYADEIPPGTTLRTIDWSGYTWDTKRYSPWGPGPNYWSDSPRSLWVDGNGLHLTIQQIEGTWSCSEIMLNQSLGYGSYEYRIASRLDQFQPEIVLGLFVYESLEAEIDIEFGKLDKEGGENAQYVIQPFYHLDNRHNFVMDSSPTSTHRFDWQPDHIAFISWKGHEPYPPSSESIIQQWNYMGEDIPTPGREAPRLNLWLFDGQPPSNLQQVEVIIKDFTFSAY